MLKYRCDVVYARDDLLPMAFLLSKLFGTPLIYERNSSIYRTIYGGRSESVNFPLVYKIKLKLEYMTFKNMKMLVTPTNGIKEQLLELTGVDKDKIFVIPNGFDSTRFYPMKQSECQDLLELPKHNFYLVYVGNINHCHDITIFIDVMKELERIELTKDLRLIIIGDGSSKPYFENYVKELNLEQKVMFLGRVSNKKVPFYINASDVCLHSTYDFAAGSASIKIFEYLACKKPLISDDINGIGYYLRRNNAVCPFKRGDLKTLKDCIKNLYLDKKYSEKISRNGYLLVRNKFTWQKATETIYNYIIKSLKEEE